MVWTMIVGHSITMTMALARLAQLARLAWPVRLALTR